MLCICGSQVSHRFLAPPTGRTHGAGVVVCAIAVSAVAMYPAPEAAADMSGPLVLRTPAGANGRVERDQSDTVGPVPCE